MLLEPGSDPDGPNAETRPGIKEWNISAEKFDYPAIASFPKLG
ncbi:hypothetical protein BN2476_590032 [Paraburkholderia piptadeniae]|uniref:Uncharacterized protein n=1 Tax=Paraburkholderia piptadeniae TaxID=1701573 RepID=A0A1N7SJR8_9BURK|nr:hypothetical protein BN2476_590032 [Paraburkholderia piptadeniae]